jgi:hypothetical protein
MGCIAMTAALSGQRAGSRTVEMLTFGENGVHAWGG